MRLLNYLFALSVVSALCACSQQGGGETTSGAASSELHDTHPLGQASVVDEVSEKNILQVAIGSADHSTLVAAVQAAKIEHVLVNPGPLTVFAPVNSAFDALPAGTVEDLLKPENKGKLTMILTGHASPGSFDVPALKKMAEKGEKVYMASGTYVPVTVEGEDVFVGGGKVLGTVKTSNGIINVVDKVILPE